jgi:7-cyano-7-deazaguanine synthase in queuosine biosynthesis
MSELVTFLSGDREVTFSFEPGHDTPPAHLFDREDITLGGYGETEVALFSGGLDSLTGAIDLLASSAKGVCLVSHQSGQPATHHTQKQLVSALHTWYPRRVEALSFRCGLTGRRASEETQRTRVFLYACIAAAAAHAVGASAISVYENGITSLNLPKRQDLGNARASRTTHPRTMRLLADFLTEVACGTVDVQTPFLWMTKTDVLDRLRLLGGEHLLSSSVSCSRTFKVRGTGQTHCGTCSQCVDRRLAAFSAWLG